MKLTSEIIVGFKNMHSQEGDKQLPHYETEGVILGSYHVPNVPNTFKTAHSTQKTFRRLNYLMKCEKRGMCCFKKFCGINVAACQSSMEKLSRSHLY